MKKTSALIAVGAIAASMLAACSDSDATSSASSSASATASGDVSTTVVSSTATCGDADGKSDVVSEATLKGDKKTLTVTYKLKDGAAFASKYTDFSGQAVVVGNGAAQSDTIDFDFAGGAFVANPDVEGLTASLSGDTLRVQQPISTFTAPAALPGTWFATLTANGEKIAQCGVFGDSVEVK